MVNACIMEELHLDTSTVSFLTAGQRHHQDAFSVWSPWDPTETEMRRELWKYDGAQARISHATRISIDSERPE